MTCSTAGCLCTEDMRGLRIWGGIVWHCGPCWQSLEQVFEFARTFQSEEEFDA